MRLVLPVFDGFTALDVVGPYEVRRMLPDAEVLLVSYERGEAGDGVGALRLVAPAALAEVERADVLLAAGGPGARRRTEEAELLDRLCRLHATTASTTSVRTGALLLAAAGGRRPRRSARDGGPERPGSLSRSAPHALNRRSSLVRSEHARQAATGYPSGCASGR